MDNQPSEPGATAVVPEHDLEATQGQQGKGPRATLVTTPDHQLAYPGLVPPPIQSPDSPKSARRTSSDDGDNEVHITGHGRKSSAPGLASPTSGKTLERPVPTNAWQTELPQAKPPPQAIRPGPPRAGTSYLNQTIWPGFDGNEDLDLTSSSGEEDEGGSARKNELGLRRRQTHQERLEDAETKYGWFDVGNANYRTSGQVKKDGRLRISLNEKVSTGYIANALGTAINKVAATGDQGLRAPKIRLQEAARLSSVSGAIGGLTSRPRLNIVIMVIGSRGDVQPFLKVGKVLKEDYGHRVRIATHPTFRDFVEKDSGLEFFSVGGDPSELMAFMVKNPGLIPTLETVKAGDIGRRRAAMAEMFDGFWRACINATDDEKDCQNLKMMGQKDPFVADAIIANPPSFVHIHCAEALGVPLHLMFTFPYTPTQAFPHPLASIKKTNVDAGYTNFISYPMVEMMVWQGLGDLVNQFRVKTLALDPVSTLWAPGATYRLHVPFTYLWSPGLVPKPQDWGSEIDIAGFVFLDLAMSYKPDKELADFLDAGEPPIYIGFGSIVVDDADRFTKMIFKAIKLAGVRALVSKGWGGLGGDDVPENIFMLDNVPHDWLFPRVSACVIHGGAGTTAIALKCGRPTMIVPFFGDQHFWGKMVGNAGVGPEPVPYKHLDEEKLAQGIKYCLTDAAKEAAAEMARDIATEGDGAINAVEHFHRELNLDGPSTMRCSIIKDKVAAWQLKGTKLRLCPLAAEILADQGLLCWKHLKLLRHVQLNDFEGPGGPVTGVASSIAGTVGEAVRGVASAPYHIIKRARKRKARQARSSKNGSGAHANKRGMSQSSEQSNGHAPSQGGAATRTRTTSVAESTLGDRAELAVQDVVHGAGRTATAIAKAPVDLSLALAQGFHNAPRLYGDDTVRRPPRVTGFQSGLRAARFELVYGVYDGFTGVVRLPIRGAKDNGVAGFVKGAGMGLTGLVLKNLAAIVGPVGYTLKGVVKQAERHKNPQRFIRRARIVQGQREFRELSQDERKQLINKVNAGWVIMKELCDVINEAEHKRGIVGHIDRLLLDTGTIFENVDIASKSLQALKKGETLEKVLSPESKNTDKSSIRRSFTFARKSRDSPWPTPSRTSEETEPKEKNIVENGHTTNEVGRNRLAVPVA